MTKKLDFDWHIKVPQPLLDGCEFDRWTEEGGLEPSCLFKVDEYGFFIYWKSEGRDGDVIELCQVSDIRKGGITKDSKLLYQMQAKYGENCEERVLTICSGTDYININYHHVVCPDVETATAWLDGIRLITHNVKANNVCPMTCLKKHWMRLCMLTDPQGKVPVRVIVRTFASGKRDKSEVCKYLEEIGLPCGKSGKNDAIEPSKFTFEKFYTLYHKICPRNDDIGQLFELITNREAETISVSQFVKFLNEKQRDPRLNEVLYPLYNETRALEIIDTYEQDEEVRKQKKLTKDGFTRYLMSDENAPVFLDRLDLYMDMDQPLSHYYINSSHNTYLVGRQFYGKSSVEMYRQVLLAGCRCVELDCWDGGGEDEEPIITHGKAMCTVILFKDVIYAIRDTAFVTSEYPVILSLENHCSKAQQYKLAKYCVDIFGDLLLKEPLSNYPLLPGKPLPSPNSLKCKILIKNKRLDPSVEQTELDLFLKGELVIEDGEKEDAAAPTSTSLDKKRKILMKSKGVDKNAEQGDLDMFLKGEIDMPDEEKDDVTVSTSTSLDKKVPDVLDGDPQIPVTQYTGSTTNVHPWLSSMVNYAQPVKFQGFDVSEKNNLHFNMSSFAETTGLGYLKSQAIEFVQYNKRQMSRIYPRGTRFESTNYLPQVFWNAGCQMVALNFQTPDLAMQLNQGKFEYNGNCGYLLKPDFMRRPDKVFDPFAETTVDGVIAAQCSVQVISGQFLSDKKVGTYVEVDMYGLPTDTIRKEFRTRMVQSNGLNPFYNEEPFFFRKVVLPDLAVLRFGVFDETGKLLGQRILPLDGLQAGFRHISLRTEANFPMSLPMLFCNIQLKIYVPNEWEELMDALSCPLVFHSAQEKRTVMMQNMGIEETDISTKDLVGINAGMAKKGSKSGNRSGTTSASIGAASGTQASEKKEEEFEPITVESLQNEKSYVKLVRKHQKELDALHRKHHKELVAVQKAQCAAIEKLIKGKSSICQNEEEVSSDPVIREVVIKQRIQWTEMKERHRSAIWQTRKQQLSHQHDVLRGLLTAAQAAQMKQLEAKQERDVKLLNQQQAKISVETTREVNNDKTLKTKAEKDRCLREKKQTNTKKFVEERRQLQTKLLKEKDKLRAKHQKQKQKLHQDLDHLILAYKNEENEYKLIPKNEFFA